MVRFGPLRVAVLARFKDSSEDQARLAQSADGFVLVDRTVDAPSAT